MIRDMNIYRISGQLSRAAKARRAARDLAPGDQRLAFLHAVETRVSMDVDGQRARLFSRPAGSKGAWDYVGLYPSEFAAMSAADTINSYAAVAA